MPLSFQSPVVPTSKLSNQKTATSTVTETLNFADLLSSLNEEGQLVSEQIPSENLHTELPEKLLENLDKVIKALQEIPQETLSPEEQDIMYAIVQMLSLQSTQMKENLQASSLVEEKQLVFSPALEKLPTILRQVDQKLQELQVDTTKQYGDAPKFVGVEGRTVLPDTIKFDQVFKQLITFIQQIETGKQATSKPTVLQQIEQLEQMEQILTRLTSLTQNLEKPTQEKESQRNNMQNVETTLPVPVTTKQQDGGGLRLEPILSEESSSQAPLTGPAVDAARVSQNSGRTQAEASAPTATVRLSTIMQDLGDVLRGSLRLSGTQEGTQIRVNIFPEHLGHLDILLTASNGKITAQIFTSNLVAKEALDLQVNQLRNSLIQQGVAIEKIEISHNTSQQSLGQQNAQTDQRFAQQKQGTSSRDKNGYQRMEEEVKAERKNSADGLMKVDYTV